MPPAIIIRGETLSFRDDPFAVSPESAIEHHADGAVVVAEGRIREIGPAAAIIARHEGVDVHDHSGCFITAGFVDCHTHYPQLEIIGSYGEQLIEWLQKYTFPAEAKFADAAYARARADQYLDLCLKNGTTTASVYCTSHPSSVDMFFEAAASRGMRMAAGKVMMDRNAPASVCDTAETSFRQSHELLSRWHGKDRLVYVISPRFAPTSTPAQLEAAAALWLEFPTALMQTHMSENLKEIAWVKSLYPDDKDYLGVYERFGLVGPGANFGHAIHLSEREIAVLRETGSGLSHCPTSNMFIGSGLFDMRGLRDCSTPIPVGMATDIGGGSSLSMFVTMKASYEISQLRGYSLHPLKAFYLATLGSAKVMGMGDKVGNLAAGYEADIIVIDKASNDVVAQRMRSAGSVSDALFAQIILADDRAIRATYVAGKKLYERAAPT